MTKFVSLLFSQQIAVWLRMDQIKLVTRPMAEPKTSTLLASKDLWFEVQHTKIIYPSKLNSNVYMGNKIFKMSLPLNGYQTHIKCVKLVIPIPIKLQSKIFHQPISKCLILIQQLTTCKTLHRTQYIGQRMFQMGLTHSNICTHCKHPLTTMCTLYGLVRLLRAPVGGYVKTFSHGLVADWNHTQTVHVRWHKHINGST